MQEYKILRRSHAKVIRMEVRRQELLVAVEAGLFLLLAEHVLLFEIQAVKVSSLVMIAGCFFATGIARVCGVEAG